jgi:hypoxanthine-DNA glycosylase
LSRKASFPPVIDNNVRILILGSLPGELSLAQSQYYANPQNQFWRLVSDIIGMDLRQLKYSERLQALLKNGIGLWDVVAEAHREGSLDSQIRNHANNDLLGLVNALPQLTTIAFNGGTAARLGLKILKDQADRYRMIQLPSSSPAYTLRYSEKLNTWQSLVVIKDI